MVRPGSAKALSRVRFPPSPPSRCNQLAVNQLGGFHASSKVAIFPKVGKVTPKSPVRFHVRGCLKERPHSSSRLLQMGEKLSTARNFPSLSNDLIPFAVRPRSFSIMHGKNILSSTTGAELVTQISDSTDLLFLPFRTRSTGRAGIEGFQRPGIRGGSRGAVIWVLARFSKHISRRLTGRFRSASRERTQSQIPVSHE